VHYLRRQWETEAIDVNVLEIETTEETVGRQMHP
jgi:hypothetical protein